MHSILEAIDARDFVTAEHLALRRLNKHPECAHTKALLALSRIRQGRPAALSILLQISQANATSDSKITEVLVDAFSALHQIGVAFHYALTVPPADPFDHFVPALAAAAEAFAIADIPLMHRAIDVARKNALLLSPDGWLHLFAMYNKSFFKSLSARLARARLVTVCLLGPALDPSNGGLLKVALTFLAKENVTALPSCQADARLTWVFTKLKLAALWLSKDYEETLAFLRGFGESIKPFTETLCPTARIATEYRILKRLSRFDEASNLLSLLSQTDESSGLLDRWTADQSNLPLTMRTIGYIDNQEKAREAYEVLTLSTAPSADLAVLFHRCLVEAACLKYIDTDKQFSGKKELFDKCVEKRELELAAKLYLCETQMNLASIPFGYSPSEVLNMFQKAGRDKVISSYLILHLAFVCGNLSLAGQLVCELRVRSIQLHSLAIAGRTIYGLFTFGDVFAAHEIVSPAAAAIKTCIGDYRLAATECCLTGSLTEAVSLFRELRNLSCSPNAMLALVLDAILRLVKATKKTELKRTCENLFIEKGNKPPLWHEPLLDRACRILADGQISLNEITTDPFPFIISSLPTKGTVGLTNEGWLPPEDADNKSTNLSYDNAIFRIGMPSPDMVIFLCDSLRVAEYIYWNRSLDSNGKYGTYMSKVLSHMQDRDKRDDSPIFIWVVCTMLWRLLDNRAMSVQLANELRVETKNESLSGFLRLLA